MCRREGRIHTSRTIKRCSSSCPGVDMPLDPAAKRFLDMMAAAASDGRSPSTLDERRQAFAKLMRFARADVAAVAGIDRALPGPAGDIPYRLYAPADAPGEPLPGFVFF